MHGTVSVGFCLVNCCLQNGQGLVIVKVIVLSPRLVDAAAFDIHFSTITNAHADFSLSVIRVAVTPVPVDGLLSATQLDESPFFVVLGLIPLVRAVFVGVPVVIVLVALVVVTLVVLAFSIFVVPIVLRAGSGHQRNRCG
jgi:hypothetical protein